MEGCQQSTTAFCFGVIDAEPLFLSVITQQVQQLVSQVLVLNGKVDGSPQWRVSVILFVMTSHSCVRLVKYVLSADDT